MSNILTVKMAIYKITNSINNKFYIGKSTISVKKRWQRHVRESNILRTPFSRAIKKYGQENFTIEILEICKNKIELCEQEKIWIKKFNAINEGYNLTIGGDGGGFLHTEASKIKIGLRHKGKNLSLETKKKISEARKGKNFRKNYNHSNQTKEKIKLKRLSSPLSANLLHALKENGIKKRKPIYQIDFNGNIIKIWDSARTVEIELGIFATSIAKCCKNKMKSSGGFIWKYKLEI